MNKLITLCSYALMLMAVALAPLTSTAASKRYVCPDCGCASDGKTFAKPGRCPDCNMNLVEKGSDTKQPTRVPVLLFDGAEIIDYAGPWEAFGEAGFKVFSVAEASKPISATFGQKIVPDHTFADSPPADILLVPGGNAHNATQNAALIKWVQEQAAKSQHVMSVCTGAFILAKAGLLDGLTATTVAHAIDELGQVFPKTQVVRDRRYVDNGKIITTAGLSSGIDGAFHLIAKVKGLPMAQTIALGMEYQWDPDAKFARGTLADTYFPVIDDFDGEMLSNKGDTTHWEVKALVSKPSSRAEILQLLSQRVNNGTSRARGAVVVEPAKDDGGRLQWNFKDEQGRNCSGSATVEDAKEPNRFVVTMTMAVG